MPSEEFDPSPIPPFLHSPIPLPHLSILLHLKFCSRPPLASLPTGIGFHIAHNLALKGARTYLSGRSLVKAKEAINQIYDLSPDLKGRRLLLPIPMELSDLGEVGRVGREFVGREGRLDILVNNAAL